jgi:amidohydrolase
MSDWRAEIDAAIDARADLLRGFRRHLHAHPEPSREEVQTTRAIVRALEEAGVPHRVPPSGRGVVAESPDAAAPGRIALRADIDALRLQDEKDVPYRSTRDGVTHACGHDAHTAMLLGAVLALHALGGSGRRPDRPPAWRALFQPAEESGEGADELIADGVMDGVGAIVALHVDPDIEVGRVARRHGPMTACCNEFQVRVQGRGGHAARPHQVIDPITAAVQFIATVHQSVPRSIDSRDPVVVSFGAISGGTQSNVIPDRVILKGTIRTLGVAIAEAVRQRMEAVARGVEAITGAKLDFTFFPGPDAVVNHPEITDVVSRAAAEVVGPEGVGELARPSLGGEDFAAYLAHAPGCLLRLGVAPVGSSTWPPLHSPRFDLDEGALVLGAKILARSAVLLSDR